MINPAVERALALVALSAERPPSVSSELRPAMKRLIAACKHYTDPGCSACPERDTCTLEECAAARALTPRTRKH